MNQSILIVFTLFLLITILLMLLFSDAKEKSGRIRVIVYISGNPRDPLITGNINSLLENMGVAGNFDFTLAEEALPADFHSSVSHSVILQVQPNTFTGGQHESDEINPSAGGEYTAGGQNEFLQIPIISRPPVWIDPVAPHVIFIAAGPDASRCADPEFSLQVREAILTAASLKKISEGMILH